VACFNVGLCPFSSFKKARWRFILGYELGNPLALDAFSKNAI